MLNRKIFSLLAILALVFALGCLGNADASADDPTAQDPKVLVYTIEQVPEYITQGSAGEIRIGLRHRGDSTKPAENVKIRLYNPSDLSIQRVDCTYDRYITKDGRIVSCENALRTTGKCGTESIVGCASDNIADERGITKSQLRYGETITSIFRVLAPPLQEQDLSRTIGYLISFDYSSRSKVSMPITTIDRQLSSNPDERKYTLEKAISPIQPDLDDMVEIVKLDEPFEFKLRFDDVGLDDGDVSGDMLAAGTVVVTLPVGFEEASEAGGCGEDFVFVGNSLVSKEDYNFVKDETKIKSCWLVARSSIIGNVENSKDIIIDVNKFTYSIDRQPKIILSERK